MMNLEGLLIARATKLTYAPAGGQNDPHAKECARRPPGSFILARPLDQKKALRQVFETEGVAGRNRREP
jgi:hypothetical protein